MDDFGGVSQGRGRRALGLIAIGLALALVGGIVYLRPFARPPQPAPATTTLTGHFIPPSDMQWPSPDEGWLVFNDGSNHIKLFHTRDAGRHWERNLLVPGMRAAGLTFFDPRNGVLRFWAEAGGASALRTKDGGRSWQPFPLPKLGAAVNGDVEFSDPQHAWLAAWAVPTPPAGVAAFDLYRTADGGRHWQRFPNGALNGLPQPPSGPPLFASAHDGWVQIASRLYGSPDGGDSWQLENLELPAPGSVSLFQATVSPGGWVTLTFQGSTPSGQVPQRVETWVAASSDGGLTWQGLVHTPETQNVGAGPNWQPPHFSDARNGWLVVGQVMYTTMDSGRTWNRKAMPAGAVCVDVTPVSARTAWCAAHYPKGVRLFRTTDGGRQWSGVDPPI